MGAALSAQLGTDVMPEAITKLALYGGAPFFGWPFKPLLNALAGNEYGPAYAHFRRDHQHPHNLAYHCLCLVLQLGFNYSLLADADDALQAETANKRTGGIVALSTTALWILSLLSAKGTPAPVRVAAIGAVVLAHTARHALQDHWKEVAMCTGVLEMMAVQVFVINKAKNTAGQGRAPFDAPQLLKLATVRVALQGLVMRYLSGLLAGPRARTLVNSILGLWMLRVSQDPFAAKSGGKATKTPFVLGFLGWILSMLTEQRWLYFYSGGFLASLCQGVSHHYSGEEGTLPQLADVKNELAHTTYFPSLLLHSVYQTWQEGSR